MLFGLPNSCCDVRRVHGVIPDANQFAASKAVCVRPINGAGECYKLGQIAGGGKHVWVLSAARIDLAAFFVHLVAANVFGAHATCNRLEIALSQNFSFFKILIKI